jgi:CelD/BcsL family acetyltransferase involved in cellulose biosynthesis
MNVAIRHAPEPDRIEPAAPPSPGTIGRIELFDDLRQVEPVWRRLEQGDVLATPYQRYDFLAPWQQHVGRRAGVIPAVLVGFGADGEPLLLCPFGRRSLGPLGIAEFLGGKHSNFNMPLWRRDVAANVGPAGMRELIARIRACANGIDLLLLRNQPQTWNGVANPFALLPHQPAPSFGYRGTLMPDFDALAERQIGSVQRGKIRRKERSLAARGAIAYLRIEKRADLEAVLDTFFVQKGERMRDLGIVDVFTFPGVREFIHAAATEHLDDGRPAIELYAMTVGDQIVATAGGVASDGRFCTMFNSMTRGELAQKSPGLLLLLNLVRMVCERGFHTFDLGVGEAPYKDMFCDEPEPLFDSFLPLTLRGHTYAAAARASYRLKRSVKQNARLWSAVQALRNLRARIQQSGS